MKKARGYIFSRKFLGERIPQSVQNLVIRDYCERNNMMYLLSATEYAMKHSSKVLFKIVNEVNKEIKFHVNNNILRLHNISSDSYIEIINIMGRKIKSSKIHDHEINLSNY